MLGCFGSGMKVGTSPTANNLGSTLHCRSYTDALHGWMHVIIPLQTFMVIPIVCEAQKLFWVGQDRLPAPTSARKQEQSGVDEPLGCFPSVMYTIGGIKYFAPKVFRTAYLSHKCRQLHRVHGHLPYELVEDNAVPQRFLVVRISQSLSCL